MILKSSLNLLQYAFCFMVWCLGHVICRISVPRPGIRPTPAASEGEVLTTRNCHEVPACLPVGLVFVSSLYCRPSFCGLYMSPSSGRWSTVLPPVLWVVVSPPQWCRWKHRCISLWPGPISLFLGCWFPECCSWEIPAWPGVMRIYLVFLWGFYGLSPRILLGLWCVWVSFVLLWAGPQSGKSCRWTLITNHAWVLQW